ncbi:MAG: AAA family ATPase [Mariprofundaceae bacterium]|nr:AAA family ATPase [Mariprofundaceae bacterium]
MKILDIQFENINALYGKWRIDFTHPDFIQHGIFAITGPTGAGKSTILDAICLALYGRTPRLDKVNQSHNDIMSRKTGHCMAEVLFETKAGQFRCQWAQRRAKGLSEGNLQTPKHEISDAISKKILAHKLKDVAQHVESLTGMNFDRFTRSMLLAQGKFASFLQASADHRAPILEQITGTDIYTQISKEAHKVHANEKERLTLLEAEINGVVVLSPEDEATLLSNYEQQEKQCQLLSEQEKIYQRDITWLNHLADLTRDLDTNQSKQQDISQQWQAMQPDIHTLQQAEQALELNGQYNTLNNLRQHQRQDIQKHDALVQQQPLIQAKQATAVNQEKQLAQSKQEKKQQYHTLLPMLKHIREQDIHIGNQQNRLNEVKADDIQWQVDVQNLQNKTADLKLQKDGLKASIKTLKSTLKEHACDEHLHEQLSGIQQQCIIFLDIQSQSKKLQKDKKTNDLLLIQHEEEHQIIKQALHGKCQDLDMLQQKINVTQQALHTLLKKQTLPEWRTKKDELMKARESLHEVIHAATQAAQTAKGKEKHQTILQKLTIEHNDVSEQYEAMKKILHQGQLELDAWQQQCDALKAIQSYEKTRLQLQDDCPCPLCGSENHPFAQGNIPILDTAEKRLKKLQAQHRNNQAQYTAFTIQLEAMQHDNAHHQQQIEAYDLQYDKHRSMLKAYCQSHPMDVLDDDFLTPLQEKYQAQEKEIQCIQNLVAKAEALEGKQQALQVQCREQRDACERLKNKQVEVDGKQEYAKQDAQRLLGEHKENIIKQAALQEKLAKNLAFFGVQAWELHQLPKIQDALQQRNQYWQQQEKQLRESKQNNARLDLMYAAKQDELKQAQEAWLLKQQHVSEHQAKLDTLKQERLTLFAERNPDDEETALIGMIHKLEKEYEAARDASVQTKQAWKNLQRDVEELSLKIEASHKPIEKTQLAFQKTLKQHGFDDEAMFCQSLLSQAERQTLKDKIRTLEQQKNTLQANITRLKEDIKQQENLQYTTQTLNECQINLDAVKKTLAQALETTGAMKQQLKEQEASQKKLQAHLEKIEAQKRELARWTNLNALIGSGDGKKFRNFAQGLTFELVVQYANQQLRHMSDRYVLQRDQELPLELNVVDYYQAGEVRSVKNISGGESFIISLALALGLSQMSSKNVKIDSLFLDEGFGTLDHESLETAIDTLSQLQQDGKIIGIISHVDSIKERIGTQIQVHPISEGKSAISGSGCYAL